MKPLTRFVFYLIITWITFTSCTEEIPSYFDAGVSKKLATYRAENISNLSYDIFFSIPDSFHLPITGKITTTFTLHKKSQPLLLDFNVDSSYINSLEVNGSPSTDFQFKNQHIIIDKQFLEKGENTLTIEFRAGETSLNRNQDFLYTLFVPDRAATAFPCFDQPDLKATFKLQLEIPESWVAVSNGQSKEIIKKDTKNICLFNETHPISTYLFSFVAGKFSVIKKSVEGREMNMYHRENDNKLVTLNADKLFEWHGKALQWLEEYTGIPYPFEKFDFVMIPSFQYGGMEHPGAILYNASSCFLGEDATLDEKLRRAGLIAHETSHMWFGDLVTMKWFDDVWLKEVFANFMADKIVNPEFPEIDHALQFLYNHYPASAAIDRTEGTHPIIQNLDNLKYAGTLYGGLIYHKAPIAMNQLEKIMGQKRLKKSLQKYLKKYAFQNATWDDLIHLMDKYSLQDMEEWSRVWIKEAGMPIIKSRVVLNPQAVIDTFQIIQIDPLKGNRLWHQIIKPSMSYSSENKIETTEVSLDQHLVPIKTYRKLPSPNFVILNGDASGYGYFELDENTLLFLKTRMHQMPSTLLRGVAWIDLYENMLHNNFAPKELLQTIIENIPREKDKQIIGFTLDLMQTIFWKFLTPEDREEYSQKLEGLLWNQLQKNTDTSVKKEFYKAYKSIAISGEAIAKLETIFSDPSSVKLNLTGNEQIELTLELAVKNPDKWEFFIDQQMQRTENSDRLAKLKFVTPALSPLTEDRDAFFKSLENPVNREHEDWVITSLRYLHHPLRTRNSIQYLPKTLDMLKEIQQTGDIFFPKRWLDASLNGYNSVQAADIVRKFLKENPDYPDFLRLKILQSGDLLFRASKK